MVADDRTVGQANKFIQSSFAIEKKRIKWKCDRLEEHNGSALLFVNSTNVYGLMSSLLLHENYISYIS